MSDYEKILQDKLKGKGHNLKETEQVLEPDKAGMLELSDHKLKTTVINTLCRLHARTDG
jgi:hypothetical protein